MNKKILILQAREEELVQSELEAIADILGYPMKNLDNYNFLFNDYKKVEVTEYSHVIMMGSTVANISQEILPWFDVAKRLIREIEKENIPFLGICFGMQFLAYCYGAKIERRKQEIGCKKLSILKEEKRDVMLNDLPKEFDVNMAHGDFVINLPGCFQNYASTSQCPNAFIHLKNKPMYGTQFHPEHSKKYIKKILKYYNLDHSLERYFINPTENAKKIISNFVAL